MFSLFREDVLELGGFPVDDDFVLTPKRGDHHYMLTNHGEEYAQFTGMSDRDALARAIMFAKRVRELRSAEMSLYSLPRGPNINRS